MVDYYRKKAEQEERKRPHKQSHDEMPLPSSLQVLGKRGRHIGDSIPQEKLDEFLATWNFPSAQKASLEAADRARIQAGIVRHKLLPKMGWREGESVAPSGTGPIAMMESYMNKAELEERKRPHKQSHDEMPPPSSQGESVAPFGTDPIAMREYYREKGEHEERNRLHKQSHDEMPPPSSLQAPHSPSDPKVKNVADKLASFVAKHGRCFEHVSRQKNSGNSGDTPFKFLFDESCSDYKYYEYRLHEEEKALAEANVYQTLKSGGESVAPSGTGPIAMMESYRNKAELEERKRPHKQSHDEMPLPSSLQAPHSPRDPKVKDVADKLASFVAKHGRVFEHVSRQKNSGNSGDTPFKSNSHDGVLQEHS